MSVPLFNKAIAKLEIRFLYAFPKTTFNVFNVLLWVQWLHWGLMGAKVKKSLIIRTIIRKSLDDWKIMLIFAELNIKKVKINNKTDI